MVDMTKKECEELDKKSMIKTVLSVFPDCVIMPDRTLSRFEDGNYTHDELCMSLFNNLKSDDNLLLQSEFCLPYNKGFIDILRIDKEGIYIYEIKTINEIDTTINFCGDTLRQLNKYEEGIKILKTTYNGCVRIQHALKTLPIRKILITQDNSMIPEQHIFFTNNSIKKQYIFSPEKADIVNWNIKSDRLLRDYKVQKLKEICDEENGG